MTEKEQVAIDAVKQAIRKLPKTLWVYCHDDTISFMAYEDADAKCRGKNGEGYDMDYEVDRVTQSRIDSGGL